MGFLSEHMNSKYKMDEVLREGRDPTIADNIAAFERANVIDRVANMASTFSGVARDRIMESSTLAGDLELDSLDRIEFGQILEEMFGIALSDEEIDQEQMGTIGGIADYLMTQRGVV